MKNNEEKDSKKERKRDLIVKIILIIIIILLLLHNCVMVKKSKNNSNKTPTGNVDIFEIKCEQSACDNPKTSDEKNNNNSINSNNSSNSNQDATTSSNGDGNVTILDKDIIWSSENRLRIFENSIYEYNEIIAPESSNVYQFVVKNATKYDLKYTIDFVEDNDFNINMKYKLKKNDTYIFDEYVSASELSLPELQLNSGDNDTYYLEWKWVSSSNDTAIGNNPSSKYKLKVLINAEGI